MQAMVLAYRRHRFAILFVSLLVTLAGEPLLDTLDVKVDIFRSFLLLNALAAVLCDLSATRRVVLSGLLGLLAVGRVLGAFEGSATLERLSDGLWIMIVLMTLSGTVGAVLERGPVNRERIFAALSAYMLAGLVFGVIYATYERLWPGSFVLASADHPLTTWHLVYFSFVTLASLGYGDITPVSEAARGLAIIEVVGGQMYLAVLVARLVSLYAIEED